MNSWGHPVTIVMLAAAVVLLAAFVLIESRVAHPLLPLRVVADRTRGGSYLAIGIAGIAMFAVFLFLTYYLQQTKGFTPIETGLAFLPMTGGDHAHRDVGEHPASWRRSARGRCSSLGMALGAVGDGAGSRSSTPTSSYVGHVLPAPVVMGVGMGNIFAPAFATATYGVDPQRHAASRRRWSTRCSRSAARSAPRC